MRESRAQLLKRLRKRAQGVSGADDGVRVLAKALAQTWTTWEEIDRMVRTVAGSPKRGPKRRRARG